jgi:hypothetical protein
VQSYYLGKESIVNGDIFSNSQCPQSIMKERKYKQYHMHQLLVV